jgi:nicotinamide phosphoribosyltransferase
MFNVPFLARTDSYKPSHHLQYAPGTDGVFANIEARIGAKFPETVWAGAQYYLREYFEGVRVTPISVHEVSLALAKHFGNDKIFNLAGAKHIVEKHQGKLPLRIKAVREGTVVPIGNVLATIENTCPQCAWLTTYVEPLFLKVWYPSTVATQSRVMKRIILDALEETGTPSEIDFKLHDFGDRGSTSEESAGLGGFGHLVNFLGTDTLPAIWLASQYYGEPMAGHSIPAAEHSTVCSWGKDREVEFYQHMLATFPTGLVAVVSDTWDIFNACNVHWGTTLREQVLERDGRLVIRPDSGDPVSVLRRVLAILGDKFGSDVNDKGFKVLHPKVRIIQGDGIDLETLSQIIHGVKGSKWSIDNLAFGSGGGLLQKMTRDTQRFAYKASSTATHGAWTDCMKAPITDPYKTSKPGRLALIKTHEGYETVREEALGVHDNQLVTIFEDGVLTAPTTLKEIRGRAAL